MTFERRTTMTAVMCAATVAHAEPTTPDVKHCTVTVALAPPEVRTEIEKWVRAEPRCQHRLEIRVVATDDGLYLQARAENGHLRERVVPDAMGAAVLVVSWIADDLVDPDTPSPTEKPEAAPHLLELINEDEHPPSTVPMRLRSGSPVSSMTGQRWLSLGATATASDRVGARGQLDLLGGERWSIGVAGGWRQSQYNPQDGATQARLVVSTGFSFGRLSLRTQLGFGADYLPSGTTQMQGGQSAGGRDQMTTPSTVVPKAEASVFATVRLNEQWGVLAGPVIERSLTNDQHLLSLFLGVQRGL